MTQFQIPGYTIEREIGHGGMATVYLAVQESLARPVALKIMAPALAADPTFGERFLKEARTVARLTHPNILAIYDIGASGHHHYMAMEYLAGGDLKARIKQGMTPDQALAVLQQVAAALDHAHRQGFVHRDIKPENILFREDGTGVLTDFGIAKAVGSGTRMTQTGMSIGTPHYMSPEQARGKQVDSRSDLYSLGAVFYEMLTGGVPYDAEDTFAVAYAHVNDPVPELPTSQSLYQPLVDYLMAKRPEERFADAGQLVKTIAIVRAGERVPRPASATRLVKASDLTANDQSRSANSSPRNYGWLWGLGGVVIAFAAAASFYFVNQPRNLMGSAGGENPSIIITRPIPKPAAPIPEPPSLPKPQTPPEYNGPSPAELAKQKTIEELLAKAKEDFAATRLTNPMGNNANERYLAVLDLDPANSVARDGLARILEKYIELSDTSIGKGDFERAEGYLSKAAEVISDSPVIESARKRLETAINVAAEQARLAEEKAKAEQSRIAGEQAEAAKRAAFENHMTAGRKALEDKEKAKAIKEFETALALYGSDPLARSGLDAAHAIYEGPKHGDTFTNELGMQFVYIAPGSFEMGSRPSDSDKVEEKLHRVTLTRGYWIQATEVTQGQWRDVMGSNPSRFPECGRNCPVEQVSWNDAQAFIKRLNSRTHKVTYRLPTEAEWEFAARSGSGMKYFFGDLSRQLGNYAWFDDNSDGETHPVAQKWPNNWGLYDVYGNVWEWCQDYFEDYSPRAVTNPTGPTTGSIHVIRGGCLGDSSYCRSALRGRKPPNYRRGHVGFRLAAY